MLHRYVRGIRHHNAELGLLERKIAGHASASEDARILMSMTGIDYFAAMLLASEIDGIGRFASPKKLVSWAGMCPTVHQSGNTMYHGRMKKDSNRKVNRVLIQAAHVAVLYSDTQKFVQNIDQHLLESITTSQKNSVFHEGFDSIIGFSSASTSYGLLTSCTNFCVSL